MLVIFAPTNFCFPFRQGLLQVPLKGHLVKGLKMMKFPTGSFDASWGPYGKPCLIGCQYWVTLLKLNPLKKRCLEDDPFLLKWSTSRVVPTHRTGTHPEQPLPMFQHTFGTHPEQPLPRGYEGIPFIVGVSGDCLGCALGLCCSFLGDGLFSGPIWNFGGALNEQPWSTFFFVSATSS